MSNGPLLFLGILLTLASSFWGLILAPQLQFGRQQPRLIEATGEYYPPARPGVATEGAEVYRSLGCAECHTRQVRQTGVHFDVWVTELTTNLPVAASAVAKILAVAEADASSHLAKLPARLTGGLTVSAAQGLTKQLTEAGAKAEAVLVTLGPDINRQWGRRMSVALDYVRDYPVQLGSLRLGPDLANFGARQSPATSGLVLKHLYEPALTMPGSIMPSYPFLFERRPYVAGEALPADSVVLKPATPELPGDLIVPNADARALLAYLLSLKAETSLFESPVGQPPALAPAPAAGQPAPAP